MPASERAAALLADWSGVPTEIVMEAQPAPAAELARDRIGFTPSVDGG